MSRSTRNCVVNVLATAALLLACAASNPASAQGLQETARLVASDAAAYDGFGWSVAFDGDTAVIGAMYDDHAGGTEAGSAYVFVRSSGIWTQQAQLIAADAAPQDYFGISVALDGDTALIGAIWDDHAGGANAGSAYVFVRSNGLWTEQAKLIASDAAEQDYFGRSVALDGDTAMVGTPGDDHAGGNGAGSAYVFARSNGVWTEQAKLTASDAGTHDGFGYSVALSDGTAAIGAVYDDHAGAEDAGSAYVFVYSNGAWMQQAKLIASDAAAGDYFGWSVVLDGGTAVIGAIWDDHAGGTDAGSAYAFVRSGAAWAEQAKLAPSNAAAGDCFGFSVALDGDTALIGARDDDHAGGTNAGSASVYARSGDVWARQVTLIASDAAAEDRFGLSVALDVDTAIIGAAGHDHAGGTDAGSAYVFSRIAGLAGDLDGDGNVDLNDLAILLASYGVDAGGDIDGDGDTDLADLAILLIHYGQQT